MYRRVLGFVTGLDDDLLLVEGVFIRCFFPVGNALYEAVILRTSRSLDNRNGIVSIPVADFVAFAYLVAVILIKRRTIRDIVL